MHNRSLFNQVVMTSDMLRWFVMMLGETCGELRSFWGWCIGSADNCGVWWSFWLCLIGSAELLRSFVCANVELLRGFIYDVSWLRTWVEFKYGFCSTWIALYFFCFPSIWQTMQWVFIVTMYFIALIWYNDSAANAFKSKLSVSILQLDDQTLRHAEHAKPPEEHANHPL